MGYIVYTTKDIMEFFGVSYSKACEIIRSIKSVSDIAGLRGKVMVEDFNAWKNRLTNK